MALRSRVRILGVDPGLRLTGYGCIETTAGSITLIEAGVIRLASGRSPPPPNRRAAAGSPVEEMGDKAARAAVKADAATVSARLAELDTDFREILDRLRPDLVAVESIFAHYKHPATGIVMGHARGVLLLAIRRAGIALAEFKPNLVKKAVTGHGLADKSQIQAAIQVRFSLPEPPRPPDVADALAIALCAAGRLDDPLSQHPSDSGPERRASRMRALP